ncbi:MAG: carbohydrate ABC transporter permease [Clostridia bacterium]|nr:carbohydrate ABC transporter permease [Clostridia bacterium]
MNRLKKHRKKSVSDIIFLTFCTALLILFFVVFMYPIAYVVVSSISTPSMRDGLSLMPNSISFEGYKAILQDKTIIRGFLNSLLYTSVGTVVSLSVTVLTGYTLSRDEFKSKNFITVLFVITLYFNGGMIPTYLVVKKLGLLNSMWSLILPSCISVYNIFLTKAHFANKIPKSLYDAAQMDGCGHWRFLLKVALPMSTSFLMVIALFFAVSYWNSYFNSMIYITDLEKLPLANFLNNILIKNQTTLESGVFSSNIDEISAQRKQLIDYSLIVFSSLPVMLMFAISKKHIQKGDITGKSKL